MNGLKKDSSIPQNTFLFSRSAQSYTESINLFSYYFSSFYSNNRAVALTRSDLLTECVSSIAISPEPFDALVAGLEDNANSGPDGIPPYFIKHNWPALCKPVLELFKRVCDVGYFPKLWKFSFVYPILKNGDKRNISNYRPISVIWVIGLFPNC